MDNISRLLLKLFSLPLASAGQVGVSSSLLSLVPTKALVNDILPGVLIPPQVDEITHLGGEMLVANEITTSLGQMRRISEIVYNQLNWIDKEQPGDVSKRALDKERLRSIEQAFDFLLMLGYALTSRSVTSLKLQPSQIGPFRYLESLRIEASPDQALVSLVGPLPHSLVQTSVQADLGTHSRIIRETEIIYHVNKPSPHLNVKVRCRWAGGEQRSRGLDNWPQKPFQDGDLEVFTMGNAPIGKIITRRVKLPHTIIGKHLHLTILNQPGVVMYETSLLDRDGSLKARSLRLFQSSGADTSF